MIYEFIHAERVHYPVRRLCQALAVAASGYYAWRRRAPSRRELANQALRVEIRAIYAQSHQTYGSPRIHAELRVRGHRCNLKRVARLMRIEQLRARHKRRYRSTTRVDARLPLAPNRLAQDFTARALNQKWLTDATVIATDEGGLFLAAVLDLCSRRVVGWALAAALDTDLVVHALEMALGRRRPGAGLLHHSDRGSVYASQRYQSVLQAWRFTVSMSGTGNCFDNAPMESFFGTLKAELVQWCHYRTRAEARQDIVGYIEGFYNATRRHSALGYRSPLEFEQAMA